MPMLPSPNDAGSVGFDLLLRPENTLNQNLRLAIAIADFACWASTLPVFKEVRITIAGGPLLSRPEALAMARAAFPAHLLEDVLVHGRTWDDTG